MKETMQTEKDVEAGRSANVDVAEVSSNEESVVAHRIQNNVWFLRKLRESEEWLDRIMGVELQGIDRIPEEEKRPPSILNAFFFWWSLNVHVGVIALGLLGPIFGLSLKSSVAATVIGTLLGALCPAYTGTLGPRTGLRQVACSRYSFGFWGAKICSVLNVVVGGGFAVVNYVVVGEILSAVSDFKMTITVGIVIIAILSYVLSIFGFRVIHTFEKYSWIITFILFCVLIGQAAPHTDLSVPNHPKGLVYQGTFLTIMAINFSNASGWCSIASDYYCNYPASTSSWKIFLLSYFGIVFPTTFSTVIGCCLANASIGNYYVLGYPPYFNAYSKDNHGLGGLLLEVYHPTGWSKFCLVMFTFSVLGNNIAINYSSGLSLQLLGHYFHAIPRYIWSFLFAVVIAVLAIAGQEHLSTIISNFVSLLGYWTVSFTLILLIEDKWFRRHEGYNLTVWDNPRKLPWGVSAVLALLSGYLIGGLLGMAQVWWTGPIAMKFGGTGGDVGVFLSGAITIVVFTIARTLERKYVGR